MKILNIEKSAGSQKIAWKKPEIHEENLESTKGDHPPAPALPGAPNQSS